LRGLVHFERRRRDDRGAIGAERCGVMGGGLVVFVVVRTSDL